MVVSDSMLPLRGQIESYIGRGGEFASFARAESIVRKRGGMLGERREGGGNTV